MQNKMTFPAVPGDTPRERFTNLVRHVISIPKGEIDGKARPKRRRKRAALKVIASIGVSMLVLSGCGATIGRPMDRPPAQFTMADTPEAKTCWRDCELIYQTCGGKCPKAALINVGHFCTKQCIETWQGCLETCPGAQPVH